MRFWRKELSLIAIAMLLTTAFTVPSASKNSVAPDKPGSGSVVITGTLVAVEGVECSYMIFLGSYHVLGNLQGFGPGDTVTITGATDIATTCQQGIPLRVISIRPA